MTRALALLCVGLSQLALGSASLFSAVRVPHVEQRPLSTGELGAKLGGQSTCTNTGSRPKACDCRAYSCKVDGNDCVQLDSGPISECYKHTVTIGWNCKVETQNAQCGQYRYGTPVKGECAKAACTKNPTKCGLQVATTTVNACDK